MNKRLIIIITVIMILITPTKQVEYYDGEELTQELQSIGRIVINDIIDGTIGTRR